MLSKEIQNKVQNLWDRLWAGGLANPITAIEQISYLLFMKRLEDFNKDVIEKYKWSSYKDLDENSIIKRVNEVFKYIQTELSAKNEPFTQAMKSASFEIDNPSLLKSSMDFIDSIYFEIDKEVEKNQHFNDIQGDVYEHLLKHTSEAGKNGQFRTPRHIIHMMTAILKPDIDGKICDVASGTGGFLVGAYQYILTQNSNKKEIDDDGLEKGIDGKKLKKKEKKSLEENTFYGFDMDKTMVRIGVMNMMMHGISKPHIINLDTLSEGYEKWNAAEQSIGFKEKDKNSLLNPKLQGQFKYILANPPFTGKIDSIGVSENLDRIYPPKYEDKKQTKRKKQTVQSELLFLERIIYMLEEEGKAAVIVPEGVLFNSGGAHKKIREILMTDCNLEGVISLPSGVFQPYTAVKTSILIFTKRKWKNKDDKVQDMDVWFYGMESDGYTLDTNRKRLNKSPLPDVINHWHEKSNSSQSDRKLHHFNVPFDEIKENGFELNFNLYKDFIYESQEFEATDKLLEKIKVLENDISENLSQLKL